MGDILKIQNFIGGKFVNPHNDKYIDNFEPSTGKVYGLVPDSDREDVDSAVVEASKAFKTWSNLSKEKRSNYLYAIADLIEKNMDELVLAESRDQGKTITQARLVDIPRAASNFRFFAGAILHTEDMSTQMDGAINYVVSQPIGVAGLISPWNLPLYLLTWKIAPAIAVGNTCVCKPSEWTSVTAWILCRLIKEAGVPDGVVNVVFGTGSHAGQAIVEHPDVHLISFTGGTVTGKKLLATCAPMIKKVSLELGGKNPNIIFNDVDLDKTINSIVAASFANQGEVCLCGERVFVQEGIYDKFMSRFIDSTKKYIVGDPNDPTTNSGAIVSKEHLDKIMSYIKLAKELGGKIECGGERVILPGELSGGYYFQPTIISGLSNSSRVCQEEIFGPVVNVIPFKTEEEAISLANEVQYGLSATIFTENLGLAQRVALKLQTGTVWINCWLLRDLRLPFGGVKMSGVGREGGKFSLDFYTEKKTVCIKY